MLGKKQTYFTRQQADFGQGWDSMAVEFCIQATLLHEEVEIPRLIARSRNQRCQAAPPRLPKQPHYILPDCRCRSHSPESKEADDSDDANQQQPGCDISHNRSLSDPLLLNSDVVLELVSRIDIPLQL